MMNMPKPRPITTERDKLLKMLTGKGISNDIIARLVLPMRGKTQEEKEKIAAEIYHKIQTGEIILPSSHEK